MDYLSMFSKFYSLAIELNEFFYSTTCHVCKTLGDNDLKQCSGCKMIFYCDRNHQKEHWPKHKDLCKAIQHVNETYKSELSALTGPYMMEFLKQMVTDKLGRRLQLYEVQMFKYSRMCIVCYKRNELLRCSECVAVWLCAQHNHDSNSCGLLRLCCLTDVLRVKLTSLLTSAYMKVPSYEKEFFNIKEFISIYGGIKDIQTEEFSPEISPEFFEIDLSARLTKPLTIVYGMRVLDYIPMYKENKTELVIHIIAAHINELRYLEEWEILHHVFPKLKYLKLVLIGPHVTFLKKQEVCDICNRSKKIYMVEWRNSSYADYVQKAPTFKRPDLVIRFYNNTFYDDYYETLQSIWKSSLKHIAQHNCPFLLCYSRKNNLDQIINTELGNALENRCYNNPFASLKPCRSVYDDDDSICSVYFENDYINVYKSLCP